MTPLNNKILYEVLPDSEQPQKSVFAPDMDKLKKCRVLDIGSEVKWVKTGDVITVYINDMNRYDDKKGYCIERSVIFREDYPQVGKVHITDIEENPLSQFTKARVIQSSANDIYKDDHVYFKNGQTFVLPDNTEIISETQIYFK